MDQIVEDAGALSRQHSRKRAVVVGAGFGGIASALANDNSLITLTGSGTFLTSSGEVQRRRFGGRRDLEDLRRSRSLDRERDLRGPERAG